MAKKKADEFEKGYGTTDIEAIKEWKKKPEDVVWGCNRRLLR